MVQEPTEEAAASARLHGVPVEGGAGLGKTSGEQSQGRAPAGYQILSKSYNTSGPQLPRRKSGILVPHHRVIVLTDEINKHK